MRKNSRFEQAMALYDRAAHFSSIADHRKADDQRKLRPDLTPEELERQRIEAGIQCPECYGIRISPRQTRFDSSPNGFQCEECGCQWGCPRREGLPQ